MDRSTPELRLRSSLLVIAGFVCLGTPVELWLAEHTESPIQLLPFALCALGALASALALLRPGRPSFLALRIVMGLVFAGSLLGIWEHLEHNIEFELEIRAGAALGDVWLEALRGANPLLAPGILALGAIIAIAATYEHPALGPARAERHRQTV